MRRIFICFGMAVLSVCLNGAFVASSIAAKPSPSWIRTGGIDQFPSELFITGTGSAEVLYGNTAAAQAEADSIAISQVAKQIKVKIRQTSQSIEREVSTQKGPLNQYDVWQQTAAYIDLHVEGVRIEDRFYDAQTKRLYSLALLDRMAQGRLMADEISRLQVNAAALIQEARKHLGNLQKVHRSVVAYRLATTKLLFALRKNQYLNLIAPRLTHRGISNALSELQADLTRFSARFDIRPISGDKQKTTIGGGLRDPITVRVSYDRQPAPSIPVAFILMSGTGQVDPQSLTDAQGIAATPVSNLGPTGNKINKIKVTIQFLPKEAGLRKPLQTLIPPAETQFSYFLPAIEDIKLAILIREFNMGVRQTESHLANRLKNDLSRSRFNIIKQLPPGYRLDTFGFQGGSNLDHRQLAELSKFADIVIAGEVTSGLAGDSYNPSLVFSQGRAVVKIVDLKTNAELGTVDVTAKSAGPSREASGKRVIQKASQMAAAEVAQEIRRVLLGEITAGP